MDTNYTYDYDPIGNRERAIIGLETNDYAANMLNQYTNITDDATYTPQYDSDGNMTSYGAFDFVWNGENRLIEVKSNGTTVVENTYDYQGRRIENISGGVTNRYIYDGWTLIQKLTHSQTHTLTNSYVWDIDLSQSLQGAGGVGGLIATIDGTNSYYAAYDANGNVTEYVDSSDGTTVAHYEYGPFGTLTASSGTKADDFSFRFSTKYFDTETEMYYYGYRFYNPSLGRWINRDPIREQGGFNIYVFVQNNAFNFIDLFGLDKEVPFLFVTFYEGSFSQFAHDVIIPGIGGIIGKVKEWFDRWGTAKDLVGEEIAETTEEISVPDCYILVGDDVRDEWKIDKISFGSESVPGAGADEPNVKFTITIEYHHVIEWEWGPDPDDPCCE